MKAIVHYINEKKKHATMHLEYDPERSSLNCSGVMHLYLPKENMNFSIGLNNPNFLYVEYEAESV